MELKKVVYENGVYRWRCETGEEFRHYEYRSSVQTGLVISAFMLVLGFLLLRDEKLLIMILTCGLIVLITLAAGAYALKRAGTENVPYEIRKDCIRIREGRGSSFVSFKRVLYMDIRENRIMLHTRFSHVPVYVPQEDFPVISRLIRSRVEEHGKVME